MTAVSLKTANGVVALEFSDGSSLLFSPDYLPEGSFPGGGFPEGERLVSWESAPSEAAAGIPGREFSPGEEEALRFAADCYRVEKLALRLIARAEQHSLGLTAKLERRGSRAAVVRAVISRLLDRNLLDDGRYAELWIRSRLALRKAPSPRWLRASLRKRGIDRNSLSAALDGVLDPETEYALLLRYLESRNSRKKMREREGKKGSFLRSELRYEGFSSAAIDRYLDE